MRIASSLAPALMCAVALSVAGVPARSAAADRPAVDGAAAGAYCVQTHGIVEHRVPVYGSNSSQVLRLSGSDDFCQYTSKKDGSRIHILLSSLYTTEPTLAVTAYFAKVPMGSGCNGNPASCYCTLLGGSDLFGGINAAGGGWYLKGAIDETLEACIFPDLSSIDSWGLAYHSAGIIRGTNLAKVVRYIPPPSEVRFPSKNR
jgi:hypothetical protein